MSKCKTKIHPADAELKLWNASIQGQQCADGSADGDYLRNKLRMAFLAGWDAAKNHVIRAAKEELEKSLDDLFAGRTSAGRRRGIDPDDLKQEIEYRMRNRNVNRI